MRRQLEHRDGNAQRHEREPNDKIRQLHRRCFVNAVGLLSASPDICRTVSMFSRVRIQNEHPPR